MEGLMSLIPWVVLPAILAGFVQSVTGFGAGIIIMMLLPTVMHIFQASALTQSLLILLNLALLYYYRKHAKLKMIILPLIFYFPAFFATLTAATHVQTEFLRPILGLFLILMSLYFIFYTGKITIRAGVLPAFICAVISAIIDAFFGMGGPPMVIYFLSITKSKEEYLGTLQAYFSICVIYGVTMRILNGQLTTSMVPLIFIGIIAIAIGAFFGSLVVDRIDAQTIKKLVYGGIGVSGIITFVTSLPALYTVL